MARTMGKFRAGGLGYIGPGRPFAFSLAHEASLCHQESPTQQDPIAPRPDLLGLLRSYRLLASLLWDSVSPWTSLNSCLPLLCLTPSWAELHRAVRMTMVLGFWSGACPEGACEKGRGPSAGSRPPPGQPQDCLVLEIPAIGCTHLHPLHAVLGSPTGRTVHAGPGGLEGTHKLSVFGLMCLLTLQSCSLTKYRSLGEWVLGVVGSAL